MTHIASIQAAAHQITGPCRKLSELTPSRVDLEVLRELPMEVQQEVAADMARARKLAAIRPLHQSSFEAFPAAPAEPAAALPTIPAEPDAEDARELWPKIALALNGVPDRLAEPAGENALCKMLVNDVTPLSVEANKCLDIGYCALIELAFCR